MWRSRRARQALGAGWVLMIVVAWNARFDHGVRAGVAHYFEQHAAWTRGAGPRPAMIDVMEAAVAQSALSATTWAGAIAVVGVGSLAWRARRPRPALPA
jgi:hypothetical protein